MVWGGKDTPIHIFIFKTTHCATCFFCSCLCLSKHLPTNSVYVVSTTPLLECDLASVVCQPVPVILVSLPPL